MGSRPLPHKNLIPRLRLIQAKRIGQELRGKPRRDHFNLKSGVAVTGDTGEGRHLGEHTRLVWCKTAIVRLYNEE